MEETALNNRAAKAREIAASPDDFQVCEGCDSIVAARVALCPNCHGYRFDASAPRVIQQAMELGSREQRSVTAADLI
jgi:hypothetical protein